MTDLNKKRNEVARKLKPAFDVLVPLIYEDKEIVDYLTEVDFIEKLLIAVYNKEENPVEWAIKEKARIQYEMADKTLRWKPHQFKEFAETLLTPIYNAFNN